MSKKIRVPLIIIAILLVAGMALFLLTRSRGTPGTDSRNSNTAAPTPITKTGTLNCLEPKNADGPHTLECAMGLTAEDGTAYGLNSEDPSAIGSIPTDTRVRVTGTLMQAEASSKYKSAGTIKVDSVDRL